MLDVAKNHSKRGSLNSWNGLQGFQDGDYYMNDFNWSQKGPWNRSCTNSLRMPGRSSVPGGSPPWKDQVEDALDVDNDIKLFGQLLMRPHDDLHNNMECTMRPTETSAYDPVFWMHHSFVDKVFAEWQSRNVLSRDDQEALKEDVEPFDYLSTDAWNYPENFY